VNVRFIAATNREPEAAVKEGILREDLYYRLRVVPIYIPPLRERPEDIPVLAKYFLQMYWMRHRGAGTPIPHLSDAAQRALRVYPWRGNVRELQNVFEHAVVLLEPGAEVRPSDIPFLDGGPATTPPAGVAEPLLTPDMGESEETYHAARDRLVAEFERRYVAWLVKHAEGNMSRAARIAGVDRTTLYRLMERHGLQRETTGLSPTPE
jgi:DNA-binding NtrC family response regulator